MSEPVRALAATPAYVEKAIEAHEDRLHRVEVTLAENTAATAVTGASVNRLEVDVGELKRDTKDALSRIEQKFEKLVDKMLPVFQAQLANAEDRLKTLEAASNTRAARANALKKAAWAIALAIVGAFSKGVVDYFSKR
jgi:chromosome segregation ATPase